MPSYRSPRVALKRECFQEAASGMTDERGNRSRSASERRESEREKGSAKRSGFNEPSMAGVTDDDPPRLTSHWRCDGMAHERPGEGAQQMACSNRFKSRW